VSKLRNVLVWNLGPHGYESSKILLDQIWAFIPKTSASPYQNKRMRYLGVGLPRASRVMCPDNAADGGCTARGELKKLWHDPFKSSVLGLCSPPAP